MDAQEMDGQVETVTLMGGWVGEWTDGRSGMHQWMHNGRMEDCVL